MYKVQLMGYIGNDAVTRNLDGGNTVTEFSIAWNPNPKDKDLTVWVKCQIWGEYGVKSEKHLTKGRSVLVNAHQVQPKIYTDKTGTQKIDLSVRVIDWLFTPSRKDSQPIASQMAETNRTTNDAQAGYKTNENDDDELPF
jgi:single-strand DNA-binding protein